MLRPSPFKMSKMEKKVIKLGFAENFFLSGTAAIVSKTMAAPLERVKLLLQNQDELIRFGRLTHPYKGIRDCIHRTFVTEGIRSFWRSNMVNCARYFPSQALNFAFNDQIKALVPRSPTETQMQKLMTNVACGGLAGVLSSCFVYSLDYARTRLANDAKLPGGGRQYTGLIDVYRQTLKTDGIQGLHRGFFISAVALMVYRGLYFGFYDSLKPVLLGDPPGVMEAFLLGYVITVTANLIAYPLDTVRRRMMMTSGEQVHYKGSIDCAMQIIRKEGPMSMMKGAGANILRNIAGAGVLVGFDKSKEFYIESYLEKISEFSWKESEKESATFLKLSILSNLRIGSRLAIETDQKFSINRLVSFKKNILVIHLFRIKWPSLSARSRKLDVKTKRENSVLV
ncbi:hypothetical protein RRG08_008754 [Elysia crispata]|uniref:ADP/ATP translocase n=1 Tax=Elysia crispata TaxID=231223 RepID=A0AAE1DT42_9GAST|nr:hypothetical protein RRG08_008754 [Elysia crispata]